MSDKPIVKINGGFPPIKDTKPVKKEKEKSFSKERGFASSNLKTVNIVWLKRDLRSRDHEPLLKAESAGIPYLIIYVFEPSRIEYPDDDNSEA